MAQVLTIRKGKQQTFVKMQNSETKLYRITKAANIFEVTPATIYLWISNGKLPAVRIGRTVRVSSSDVDAILLSNRTFSRQAALS